MSERESGLGAFALGVTVGVVLGFLFAPEPGEEFRGSLARRLARLRALAEEKAGELGALVGREDEEDEEGEEREDASTPERPARALPRGRRRTSVRRDDVPEE